MPFNIHRDKNHIIWKIKHRFSFNIYERPFKCNRLFKESTVSRAFANGSGDLGSIRGHVIPKTLKMVLDTSLLNTQQYKICIKSKVEQSRERSSALPYTSVW